MGNNYFEYLKSICITSLTQAAVYQIVSIIDLQSGGSSLTNILSREGRSILLKPGSA